MIILAELQRKIGDYSTDLWSQFYGPSALPAGFTVLDPFLGGGTTLIEATKQGANCIGVDIDPVACFITELELAQSDSKRIKARFEEIRIEVEAILAPLYRSTYSGEVVDVVYFFWVDRVSCPSCSEQTDAHPTYQLVFDSTRKRQTIVCPECDQVADKPLAARWHNCSDCGARTDLKTPPISTGKFTCPTATESTRWSISARKAWSLRDCSL